MEAELSIEHEESNGLGAFFIEREGKRIAEQAYRRLDEHRVVIVHTEVDASLRGQGVARSLLDTAVAWRGRRERASRQRARTRRRSSKRMRRSRTCTTPE